MYEIKVLVKGELETYFFNSLDNPVYKSFVELGLPIFINYFETEEERKLHRCIKSL